jgi:predicted DCC family thiol-disulfide oxidoreductase YuxK
LKVSREGVGDGPLLRDLPMVEKPLIVFDGECNLCNWAVNFVLGRDKGEIFLFSPNQSDSAREILTKLGLDSVGDETVYLIEKDRIYSRSTAVLLVLRRLPFPWKLLSVFIIIPKRIRDFIYDVIAKHRYEWFGKMNSCRVPSQGERNRFLR